MCLHCGALAALQSYKNGGWHNLGFHGALLSLLLHCFCIWVGIDEGGGRYISEFQLSPLGAKTVECKVLIWT